MGRRQEQPRPTVAPSRGWGVIVKGSNARWFLSSVFEGTRKAAVKRTERWFGTGEIRPVRVALIVEEDLPGHEVTS